MQPQRMTRSQFLECSSPNAQHNQLQIRLLHFAKQNIFKSGSDATYFSVGLFAHKPPMVPVPAGFEPDLGV